MGPVQAARLRLEAMDKLAFFDKLEPHEAQLLQARVDQLEREHPGIVGLDDPRSIDDYSRNLRAQPGDRQGVHKPKAKPPKAEQPAKPKPAGGARRSSGSGRGSRSSSGVGRRAAAGAFLGARSRRYVEQTGIPSAARSATSTALQFAGVLVGLSLAYLLLSNAERPVKGRSAIELFMRGLSTGVARVIGPGPLFGAAPKPVKPLSPARAQAVTAVLPGAAAAVPGSGAATGAAVGAQSPTGTALGQVAGARPRAVR